MDKALQDDAAHKAGAKMQGRNHRRSLRMYENRQVNGRIYHGGRNEYD